MSPSRLVPLLAALSASLGCASSGSTAPPPAAPAAPAAQDDATVPAEEAAEQAYVLVYLLSGEREAQVSAAEMQEAMNGHFANMQRLGEEGLLLVAGPLGAPRLDPAHRGIFVFDVPDVERGRELAASDPSVQAGVLAMRVHPFRSEAPLRELLPRERAAREARLAAGGAAFAGTPLVLVSAREDEGALEALAPFVDEGLVLFWGRLGGELEGQVLFALDVATTEEARELLDVAAGTVGREIGWQISPWFSSEVLRELPALARTAAPR